MTRSGCHLCSEAEPVVRRVAARRGLAVESVDIDADDDLIRLYAFRIPVVLGPGDEVIDEGIISERSFRRALRQARRRRG